MVPTLEKELQEKVLDDKKKTRDQFFSGGRIKELLP